MDGSRIALQLYTVRSLTAQDMAGTLQELARIGYRSVEPAGYGNLDAAAMRRRSTPPASARSAPTSPSNDSRTSWIW